MARLPSPGGDVGNWGTILNTYLLVAHDEEGNLISGVVGTPQFQNKAVNTDRISSGAVTQAKLDGAVSNIIDSAVRTSHVGQAGGVASLGQDGKIPDGQLPTFQPSSVGDANATTKGVVMLNGDLASSAASPQVIAVGVVAISGTPTAGQILLASGSASAVWADPPEGQNTASQGSLWTTTIEPTITQGVKNGDMWVDSESDTDNILTKVRHQDVWVTVLATPKTTGTDAETTAPAGLLATEVGDTFAKLSWQAPSQISGTLQGYNIYSDDTIKINDQIIPSTTTTYTVENLAAATTYRFTVRAVTTDGEGPSAEVSVTTTGENNSSVAPLAPTNIVATPGDGSVSVAFESSSGATSYTATSDPDGIMATGASSPLVVEGLTNGTSYTFTVTASNTAGRSPASEASSAVTPAGESNSGGVIFPSGTTVKIMPLGDSVVEGMDGGDDGTIHGGFRTPLAQLLSDGGYQNEYVGPQTSGSADAFDDSHVNHAGFSGWKITDIENEISTKALLTNHSPDVLLIHLAGNDIFQGASGTEARNRMQSLLTTIFNQNSTIKVFLSTNLITEDSGTNTKLNEYNSLLPALVKTFADAGRSIWLVDISSKVSVDLLGDGYHPNSAGYEVMADEWYKAIVAANNA